MEHEKITKLLTANGLTANAARVLACWNEDEDELTAWDIGLMARLRQPEVSIVTRDLHLRGWLSIKQQRQEGKGRPLNIYSLARPMRDIVREIVAERTREIDQAQELTVQLLQAVA